MKMAICHITTHFVVEGHIKPPTETKIRYNLQFTVPNTYAALHLFFI